MSADYGSKFQTRDIALHYDSFEYSEGSYSSILWEVEKWLILDELHKLQMMTPQIEYLDFACGTGRIVSFLEAFVANATGIDISSAMLDLARAKVNQARLFCADITDESVPIEGQYDLITSFRFLSRAEPPLRRAALTALVRRLRNQNSRLIINNHGNRHSFKRLARTDPPLQLLAHDEIVAMLEAAGLTIVSVHGYGQLSRFALKLLSPRLVQRLESSLTDAPLLRWLGANQLYVARLRQ